ncbi:unnamed protein product, partial [Rotaria magnacalcarata]
MRFLKSSKAKPSMTKAEETTDNPIFKIAGNIWPTQAMIDDDTDSKIAPSQEIKKVL